MLEWAAVRRTVCDIIFFLEPLARGWFRDGGFRLSGARFPAGGFRSAAAPGPVGNAWHSGVIFFLFTKILYQKKLAFFLES